MERKCLTPGMVLHTNFLPATEHLPAEIVIKITMPEQNFDEATAEAIDERLHDGIEYALAPYWVPVKEEETNDVCSVTNSDR